MKRLIFKHELLLSKLAKFNVTSHLIKWIESYLQGTELTIRLKGLITKGFKLPFDIPQGSHLVPLLFIIFRNES